MPAITDTPDALKIYYPPRAVKTLIQENQKFRPKLTTSLPPGASRIGEGYELRFGARLAPSQNNAQIADGGNFPIQKPEIDRTFVFKPTIFAADYDVSGLQRFVANSNVAAYNGGVQRRRPEETMSSMGKLIEQIYVGGDGSGIMGYVEADGANTITVKNPHGVRYLPKNAYISVRIAAGSTVRDSLDLRLITARDRKTRILTYSGANQTAVADDPIYRVSESALAGATLAAIHANGLRGQIDDGVVNTLIHTLDRTLAGNEELQSYVDDFGGETRNLTEQLLMQSNHEVLDRTSAFKPSTLIMNWGQVEKYIEFVAPQRRWPITGGGTQGKTTGYKESELRHDSPSVSFDFLISQDCMPGEVYGISWEALFLYSAVDAQWMSGHDMGNLLMLPGSNGATHRFAWGAYLVSVENWGTDHPLAHFKIKDLKDRLNGTA